MRAESDTTLSGISNIETRIQKTAQGVTNTSSERVGIEYAHVQNTLAPISSLPSELLSAIFEAGDFLPPLAAINNSALPFEIAISQITARWRYVALSTPRLWTRIYIRMNRDHLDKTETYLQRSKALLLDLRLTI